MSDPDRRLDCLSSLRYSSVTSRSDLKSRTDCLAALHCSAAIPVVSSGQNNVKTTHFILYRIMYRLLMLGLTFR